MFKNRALRVSALGASASVLAVSLVGTASAAITTETVESMVNPVLTDAQTIFAAVLPIGGSILALYIAFKMIKKFVTQAAG